MQSSTVNAQTADPAQRLFGHSDQRLEALLQWLEKTQPAPAWELSVASADASFRRYFRLSWSDGNSAIAMDAPPPQEDCAPFVAIAKRLRAAGLRVPVVLAEDLERGYLLLSDLGQHTLLPLLQQSTVDQHYHNALQALLGLQAVDASDLPVYDEAMLRREMQLFPDWLLQQELGLTMPAGLWQPLVDTLITSALSQPQRFVHRDYHSRNLIWVEHAGAEHPLVSPPAIENPGILDFQDAVLGPITYDAVSLLKDCYVRWPRAQVLAWFGSYLDMLASSSDSPASWLADSAGCQKAFDFMGVQRHLKAAGIFARLLRRDNKPGYMGDVPRTLGYIVELGSEYAEIAEFASWLQGEVLPALVAKGIK